MENRLWNDLNGPSNDSILVIKPFQNILEKQFISFLAGCSKFIRR